MRVLDVGDPVAQRLVDRVLEDAVAQRDLHDFRAEHAHARHVERLASGIDLTHVDAAFETEHGAYRGGRHTMLAGARFGDHARFAHALDEQRLPQRVVDFVGAGVVEVLTLQENPCIESGLLLKAFGETRRLGQRRGTSYILLVEPCQFLVEFRVGLGFRVDAFQFIQRRDQRLRDVTSAELSKIRSFVTCQRGLFGCLHSCSCLY